jgi:hypothetical protein
LAIAAVGKSNVHGLGIQVDLIPRGIKKVSRYGLGDFGTLSDTVQQISNLAELGLLQPPNDHAGDGAVTADFQGHDMHEPEVS